MFTAKLVTDNGPYSTQPTGFGDTTLDAVREIFGDEPVVVQRPGTVLDDDTRLYTVLGPFPTGDTSRPVLGSVIVQFA